MGTRNYEELGENLQLISKRLMANKNLLKWLYYTDKDPLSGADLSEEQIQKEVFEKLIRIVPRVGPKETANSIVVIEVKEGTPDTENTEFQELMIVIEIFVPLTQWIVKNKSLRPFLIMSEINKSLNGKTINGLGKIKNRGFTLNFLTEEISAYKQVFTINSYD
ncbi:MAG: hypothetical protein SPE03_05240 [Treponema sp.]|nr:hypothetical protein [Treponema sp.]